MLLLYFYLENPILSSDNSDMIYVPNFLTLLRIASVPFIIILLFNHSYEFALWLFVLAGLSDGLDGFIAKRYGCVTKLGTMLDPLADKCLLVAAFVMLSYQEYLPFWVAVVVVFRDLIIIGGVLFVTLLVSNVALKPLVISKLNTVMQIFLVFITLLKLAYPHFLEGIDWSFLFFLVAGTSILSGLAYIWQGLLLTMQGEKKQL